MHQELGIHNVIFSPGICDAAGVLGLNAGNTMQPLTVRMGINSGVALVGSTRFEGLHGARWTFIASGPVTNLAARLAGLAKPGEILLDRRPCSASTAAIRCDALVRNS